MKNSFESVVYGGKDDKVVEKVWIGFDAEAIGDDKRVKSK